MFKGGTLDEGQSITMSTKRYACHLLLHLQYANLKRYDYTHYPAIPVFLAKFPLALT